MFEPSVNQIRKGLARLGRADPIDAIAETADLMDTLRQLSGEAADTRRAAVRQLRSEGWTLKQIAEATGLTDARISQIETGYNRKERQAREAATRRP